MEIDEGTLDNGLDQETWLKIFGYLPKSDRANVRLVNSLFNKLICEIEKFQYVLKVCDENLTDIGILLTNRRFKEVNFWFITFNSLHLMAMCEILRVHGKSIEIMKISSRMNHTKDEIKTISAYRVLSLFELVPNLKKLDWWTLKIQINDWRAHDPLLEKLEYLRFNIYEETSLEFAYIFTPGTIKKLNFGHKWKYLKELMACQSNIKDLILEESVTNNDFDFNVFNQLQLDSLTIDEYERSAPILIQMLGQHPELKKVITDSYYWPTPLPLFRAYCSLVNLEYLELMLDHATLNELHRIAELTKLREIKLDICDYLLLDYDEGEIFQVALIQLPNVEKVSLGNQTNVLFLQTAGQNWPNVKHFEAEASSKFYDGMDVLNYYLDNFEKLESLVIRVNNERPIYEDVDGLQNNLKENIIPFEMLSFIFHLQQYPHLKNLRVQGAGILHLEHLITALPNLELLHIDQCCFNIYSPQCLINLLQLKQLKDLKVKFTQQSKFAGFTVQEGILLKKLCRRLQSFRITLEGCEGFQTSIRTLLEGYDTFAVKIQHYNKLTILENVKY